MASTPLAHIHVYADGRLVCGDVEMRCALGKGGVTTDKHEGDGATPLGTFMPLKLLYRKDRIGELDTLLPAYPITPQNGWCDDPSDPMYNMQIELPYQAHHEELWREDHIYDLVVVIDYNTAPAVPNKGSAVFIHLAREGYPPTDGCAALSREDMLTLLGRIDEHTLIDFQLA